MSDVVDGSGLESLRRSVADLQARVASMAARTYRGADTTGLVEAEVSSTGAVLSVEVSAQAVRELTAGALGAACVEAVLGARAALGRAAADLAVAGGGTAPVPGVAAAPPEPWPDRSAVAARLRRTAAGMA